MPSTQPTAEDLMVVGKAQALAAVSDLFAALDCENWDSLADHLDQDVELADELTGTWLRGHVAVAGYLRAQRGVVTHIVSTPKDIVTRSLSVDTWLITFNFDQRYCLGEREHFERLTGLCIVRVSQTRWQLLTYHLGGSTYDATDLDVISAKSSPLAAIETIGHSDGTLGERVRSRRNQLSLSLREVAKRAGVSASLVSQVERSLTDPGVHAMTRIAAALDVPISKLIGEAGRTRDEVVLARNCDRHHVGLQSFGITVESFPTVPNSTLSAHIRNYSGTHHGPVSEGTESDDTLLYLLDGAAEINAAGGFWTLQPDDAVVVRGATRSELRPILGSTARVLVVQASEQNTTRIGARHTPGGVASI